MVEFRLLRFKVSRMSQDALVQALRSCKELEARIVKRLNSFQGEFLEPITDEQEVISKPEEKVIADTSEDVSEEEQGDSKNATD